MKSKSILLKSVICGLVYLLFILLLIFIGYITDLLGLTQIIGFGAVYGVVIAVVTYCDTAKRTIIARVMGILSAVVLRFILHISGIPYILIIYISILNGAEFEVAAYKAWIDYFWMGLLVSFFVSIISIFLFKVISNRKK